MLRIAYPSLYQNADANDLNNAVKLWTAMFEEDDPGLVMAAAKAFIATDTKGFPPHIGAIKEKMRILTKTDMPTPMEAWGNVWKTMKKNRYDALKTFNELPPIVRSVIGYSERLAEWNKMSIDQVETVVSSNFQKAYRERVKEKQEYEALPRDIRAMYEATGRAKYLEGNTAPELPPRQRLFKSVTDEEGYQVDVEVSGNE